MKIAAWLFIGGAVFFLALFGIYWFTSYEQAGGTLLALGVPACLIIGGYLALQVRKTGDLAEDAPGATPEDSAGEIVSVPAASLWPVGLAFGAGTFAAGLVLGPWLAAPGAIVLVLSIVGISLRGRDY